MRHVTFVMYHYVRDLELTRYPRIKGLRVSEFRQQLAYMQRFYHFVTLQDCLDAFNGATLPQNPAVLTFDDGLIDHYDAVFPILHQQGIQGWFFPPASPVLCGEVLDVHKIHFVLATADESELFRVVVRELDERRGELELPEHAALFAELSQGSRFDSPQVTFVKKILQRYLPQPHRSQLVQQLFRRFVSVEEASFAAELYVSLDQLRCMINSGMYVGAHGFRHVWLDQSDRCTQIVEIEQSLAMLRQIGAPTANWVFSYPYGAFTPQVIELARERGCAFGLTTDVGLGNLVVESAFKLLRLDTNDLPKLESAEPCQWTLHTSVAPEH